MPKRRRIFIDLDGVGADFDGHYLRHFGKDLRIEGAVSDEELWANIDAYDGDFFFDLPVMPGFREAMQWLKDEGIEVIYLTACPADTYEYVARQKHDWVRLVLEDEESLVIPIVGGKNKAKLLQFQGDVLVDDFVKNIIAWNSVGGRGIVHKDWETTRQKIIDMEL